LKLSVIGDSSVDTIVSGFPCAALVPEPSAELPEEELQAAAARTTAAAATPNAILRFIASTLLIARPAMSRPAVQ
jgi:hypothetical protein